MENNKKENGKNRSKTLILAAISGVLGLAVAGAIFAFLPTNIQTMALGRSSSSASDSSSASPKAEAITLPTGDALTVKKSTPVDSNGNPITSNGATSGGSNGGGTTSGGNNGGGATSGGTDPGYTDSGNSSAGSNYCPESRAENPSVWDSCRAGYVAPTIQWGGVTSCTPIDKNAGTWSVTYKWNAVGGNWKGYWSGVGNDGSSTVIVNVNPGEASSEPILLGRYADLTITDMNGWGWIIDRVYSAESPYTPMNTVCH